MIFCDDATKRPLYDPFDGADRRPDPLPIHAPAHPFNRRPLFFPKKIDLQPLRNANQAAILPQHSYAIVHSKLFHQGLFRKRGVNEK